MVQPQHNGESEAAQTRLSRFIAEHIAKGNQPDHTLAQQRFDAFKDTVSRLEPRNLTEQQIDDLVREHCGRGCG
jgi:hypothetical protein